MPARMIINTESTMGYNNKLKQAVSGMKLGVNEVNPDTKEAALRLMQGGPSKINPQTATRPTRYTKRLRPNQGKHNQK